MTTPRTRLTGAALVVGGALVGLAWAQPDGGGAKAGDSRRYEVLLTGQEGRYFVLVDTATGHCWERSVVSQGEAAVNPRSEWTDVGEPPFETAPR